VFSWLPSLDIPAAVGEGKVLIDSGSQLQCISNNAQSWILYGFILRGSGKRV
jgi:hypothetical protein